ncbi:hypothetical protein J7T55_015417 [Diaporthe amygdali]|uniref:uncharacterized protein n=1 Tax=Phomopsis amygdali TaxID=1214568 RepID=UPI0022FDEAA9|nr:uncharacterized protein J7T55_015417 [Diaporthe amygdali]KAJ0120685.1 hypothetical protein J7T55_015417 [Diaporthe amygdali]
MSVNYCEIALAKNPSGAEPNFVDPPSLLATVQAVGITFGIVALLLILSRLYIRVQSKNALGVDDAFIVVSFALAVAYTSIAATFGPVTRHAWDLPVCYLDAAYIKKSFVASLFYGPMLFFAKASILLLYYRAFSAERWMKWCIYLFMVIMFAAYWMTVQAGMNIAVDVAIIILPLPIIYKLHMPFEKKIGLAIVFATGLFALVASLLTVNYRILIVYSTDSSWAGAQTYICIQAEVYVTLAVACMPSLAKFWNIKLVKSAFYRSFQSLLSRVRGSDTTAKSSFKNVDEMPFGNDSTAVLQRGVGYVEIRPSRSSDGRQVPNGIYKMTTFKTERTAEI